MKLETRAVILTVFLSFWISSASAAQLSIDSSTIFRVEQRDLGFGDKQKLMPVTQFLGLDAEKLADGNLSLHLYGWGRGDLGDKSYNDDKVDGTLTYGYLRYRFNSANADIRGGRFFINQGIANEQLDGVNLRTDLPGGFGVSAFGGAVVHNKNLFGESSDGKGDYLYGGRFHYRYARLLELGLSGVYEADAPVLVHYANGSHRAVGLDIWLHPMAAVELIGHTSYNTETAEISEHSYLLNFKALPGLLLSGEFDEHRDRDYLYSWSMFSGAGLNPADKSRSTGGTISYALNSKAILSTDYKHYDRQYGSADRYGGDLKLSFLENSLRSGIGYHYLNAGATFAVSGNPSASYQQLRLYSLHDTKGYFASVDLLGFFFKDKIYDTASDLEASLSLGYHLTTDLAISGDVSYGRNPEFSKEIKGLIRLTYNPVFSGKGEKR